VNELPRVFIEKWIVPFYHSSIADDVQFDNNFKAVKNDLTSEIVKDLLGFFDWRSRIVGATFAALMDYREFEEIIGIHLLKSEVCYAAKGYCIALAYFNSDTSIDFLKKYLDYYLTKNDLWYDQNHGMAAIIWLDKINNTKILDGYMDQWKSFVIDKPNLKLDSSIEYFNNIMIRLQEIKSSLNQ
jgi:hypothetical protein